MGIGTSAEAYGTHRSIMQSGYVRIWEATHPLANNDGYVLEHRKVVYDAGIDIPKGHHVHHINGDRSDNRLENLIVMSASDHLKHHTSDVVVNQFGTWSRDGTSERRKKAGKIQKLNRIERGAKDSSLIPHGTVGGSTNWNCKCNDCRDAFNSYKRNRRRIRKLKV